MTVMFFYRANLRKVNENKYDLNRWFAIEKIKGLEVNHLSLFHFVFLLTQRLFVLIFLLITTI